MSTQYLVFWRLHRHTSGSFVVESLEEIPVVLAQEMFDLSEGFGSDIEELVDVVNVYELAASPDAYSKEWVLSKTYELLQTLRDKRRADLRDREERREREQLKRLKEKFGDT